MKEELGKLLREYLDHCKAESKKVEKEDNNLHAVEPTLEGFADWLEGAKS